MTGPIIIDIINDNGTSIFSTTKLRIEQNHFTSVDASTGPTDYPISINDDDRISINIDDAGSGSAAGLKINFIGQV